MWKRFFVAVFFCMPLVAQANQKETFEIAPFLLSGYSEGFSREIEWSVDMDLAFFSLSLQTSSLLTMAQSKGSALSQYGKEWLGVSTNGKMVVDDETVNVSLLDLYDPVSKQLVYVIDHEDESVRHYEWTQVPARMRSGELKTVGKISERSKEGALISTGEVKYLFKKTDTGYEFCHIERTVKVESKEKTAAKDCDLFDKNKKIFGFRFEMHEGSGISGKGEGRIRVR